MNARIKQLAEQARKEYLKLPTGYRPEQVGMYRELMEKFAELIVRECVYFVGDLNSQKAKEMLEHFGVK